eukprot:TRINITY_DN23174_c0_g1_i2.p1 TRINITY_DN23174_c0_g1~~TRINITY_DN23174_c0_g1_i2.p1  ORF type:complete len:206 (+),score=42.52 TRINITY_DN23174_c0_g1_i2:34-651(+)
MARSGLRRRGYLFSAVATTAAVASTAGSLSFASSSARCHRKSRSVSASLVVRHVDVRSAVLPANAIVEFEPTGPSWPQMLVVLLCGVLPMVVWWYVVVPNKRREVAASKRKGELKQYLTELAASPDAERKGEKWFYDKYLREAQLAKGSVPEGRLTEAVGEFEGQLQEALPGGGFWSFDNPIFVTLVMVACVVTVQNVQHELGLL